MGWASGSRLFSKIIEAAKEAIPDDDARERFYRPVIAAFEDEDWDTQNECCGDDDVYDQIYDEKWGE
jgi:hypothetical protein